MKLLFKVCLSLLLTISVCGCDIRQVPESTAQQYSSATQEASSVPITTVPSESAPASSAVSAPTTEASAALAISEPSTPFVITPTGAKQAPDPERWYLHLVNLSHPLPDDYAPPLATLSGGYYSFDARAAQALDDMLAAASNDGVAIYVTSAYRSKSYQEAIYESEINYYRNQGYDEVNAVKLASSLVAVPGTSEHQLGLATDLITPDHPELLESFEETEGFAWLDQHAAEHGFILRYPKDKVELTGIAYEPWHYRYVGVEHAKEIKRLDMCLEEYLDFIDEK